MKKCEGCDKDIPDDKRFCSSCNHKKRNLKYLLEWGNAIFEDIFLSEEEQKEEDKIVIAS